MTYAGTFTIIARDPATGRLGIGTQSKVIAVGAAVPWAAATVGAVATQAWSNPLHGPRALELLRHDVAPDEVIRELLHDDEARSIRQIGLIDASGRSAAYTGPRCIPWAGHVIRDDLICLGNILVGEEVVARMADAFAGAEGDFVERLVAALAAGQEAGGDRRGRESAALLVVREQGDDKGIGDREVDLRVDLHADPIGEVARLLRERRGRAPKIIGTEITVDQNVALRLQASLAGLGFYTDPLTFRWDERTQDAFRRFCSDEGLPAPAPGADSVDVAAYERLWARYLMDRLAGNEE